MNGEKWNAFAWWWARMRLKSFYLSWGFRWTHMGPVEKIMNFQGIKTQVLLKNPAFLLKPRLFSLALQFCRSPVLKVYIISSLFPKKCPCFPMLCTFFPYCFPIVCLAVVPHNAVAEAIATFNPIGTPGTLRPTVWKQNQNLIRLWSLTAKPAKVTGKMFERDECLQ